MIFDSPLGLRIAYVIDLIVTLFKERARVR